MSRELVARSAQLWLSREGTAPGAHAIEKLEDRWEGRPGVKPTGGLWTSMYLGLERGSDWVRWCLGEHYETANDWSSDEPAVLVKHAWVLSPVEDARIYTIDTYEDLRRLVVRYPHGNPDNADGVLDRAYPHWLDVSEDYDGVHLSEMGQFYTRLSHPLSLYGWDCESTLWFRWCFDEVQSLGEVTFREPAEDEEVEAA